MCQWKNLETSSFQCICFLVCFCICLAFRQHSHCSPSSPYTIFSTQPPKHLNYNCEPSHTATIYLLLPSVHDRILERTLNAARGERKTSAELQTLWSAVVFCLQDIVVHQWHQSCVGNQPVSDWISRTSIWDRTMLNCWVVNDQGLDRPCVKTIY